MLSFIDQSFANAQELTIVQFFLKTFTIITRVLHVVFHKLDHVGTFSGSLHIFANNLAPEGFWNIDHLQTVSVRIQRSESLLCGCNL
jgi:hypothetical protein